MSDPDWGAAPQDTSTHDALGPDVGDRPAARGANEPVQQMADAIGRTDGSPGDLTDLSRTELLALARRRGIGADTMSKAELVEALRPA